MNCPQCNFTLFEIEFTTGRSFYQCQHNWLHTWVGAPSESGLPISLKRLPTGSFASEIAEGAMRQHFRYLIAENERIQDLVPGAVMADVYLERQRQDRKWGIQNHDDYRWLAIISEELGEVAQAALHTEFGGRAANTVRDELVQVVAVGIQWIEAIDRRLSGEISTGSSESDVA